jgi:hypothetical protein
MHTAFGGDVSDDPTDVLLEFCVLNIGNGVLRELRDGVLRRERRNGFLQSFTHCGIRERSATLDMRKMKNFGKPWDEIKDETGGKAETHAHGFGQTQTHHTTTAGRGVIGG